MSSASPSASRVFFTADLHLGHARIHELAGRPFSGPDATFLMNEVIISNWNSVVAENDYVYVLGDVALGKIADSLPLVSRLNGRKFLIPGNHDRCFEGAKKPEEWTSRYLDAGFHAVCRQSISSRTFSMPDDPDFLLLMSHFPYKGDSHDADRFTEYRFEDEGDWLLHGHTHGRWLQKGRMIDVGVDAWGGYPVAEEVIIRLIREGERTIGPVRWV